MIPLFNQPKGSKSGQIGLNNCPVGFVSFHQAKKRESAIQEEYESRPLLERPCYQDLATDEEFGILRKRLEAFYAKTPRVLGVDKCKFLGVSNDMLRGYRQGWQRPRRETLEALMAALKKRWPK